jgi:SAM-dependent methyltransferase
MKICLACRSRFEEEDWKCAQCGYLPEFQNGYPLFAREISNDNGGFEAYFFCHLAQLEKGNFWFESRNRLLVWAFRTYFPNARKFLEIGCGTGFVLSGFYQEFPGVELYGSDVFVEGLAYAQSRTPNGNFLQMDGRQIPFDQEFDVIGAFDVLEHIEEDATVLREIHRSVKLGGGLILTVPQHRWLWTTLDEVSHHKRRYSREELVAKIEAAGFEIAWVTSFLTLLLPLMIASRLRWHFQGDTSKTLDKTTAEFRIPLLVDRILEKVCDLERAFLSKGLSLPVGGSLLLVGMKG